MIEEKPTERVVSDTLPVNERQPLDNDDDDAGPDAAGDDSDGGDVAGSPNGRKMLVNCELQTCANYFVIVIQL